MIYIVSRNYSDYGGCSSSPIGYTLDEATAKAEVAKWEARKARSVEVRKACSLFRQKWELDNPRPSFGNVPTQPKLPHEGIAKRNMTPEQLADRERAKAAHQLARIEATRPFQEWSERFGSEFDTWIRATFNEQEIKDTCNGISSIEEDFEYEQLNELA